MKSMFIKLLTKLASFWTKLWFNKIFIVKFIYWKLISYFGKNKELELVKTKYSFDMYISKWWLVVEKTIKEKWVWEQEITDLVIDNLTNWDVFIDVWANIWRFTLLASSKVWNNWKVIAFEPSKYNYNILKKNVQHNWYKNIEIIKKWLWSKRLNEKIHYVPNNPWHSSILEDERNKFFDKENIEINTMDSELKNLDKITLIKIDVEWYEYEVFLWMKNIIKKYHPMILLEFTPNFYETFYSDKTFSYKFLKDFFSLWYDIYHINEISLRGEFYKDWLLVKIKESEIEQYINREQSNLLLTFKK